MRKTTALTLALLALLSFLFFMSPVGTFVLSSPFQDREVSPHGSEAPGELPFSLPEGFEARVYADVPGARVMARDPGGVMYVSDDKAGKIYRIARDR